MLKYFMHKIIYIFIIKIIFLNSLMAKEPVMAILNSIASNPTQKFNIKNYTFYCKAYGVISLEELYNHNSTTLECKNKIKIFYKKNPKLKYYAVYNLHAGQAYHVEFRNNQCLLYAKGKQILSELLLKNGLAFIEPRFNDIEFNYRFKESLFEAKVEKKGLWNTTIEYSCISQLRR
jgi:hypothetical protein